MANKSIIKILVQNKLKVTPQRIAILEVILILKNHPTVDNITEYLRLSYPNISPGTVYRTLDIFSKKGIIHRIYTENNSMRYDTIKKRHHHLYCSESDRIKDFYDNRLTLMIEDYLKIKKVPYFKIEDINLQIVGKFTD
jgi:Fur family peroxide stress response transcriptional regulator